MSDRLRDFIFSSAMRDVTRLASLTIFGQAIVLALSPVLTRLFTPADFAFLGTFGAAVAVLSVVVTLGYDQAIIAARSHSEALRLVAISIALGAVLSLTLPGLAYLGLGLVGDTTWSVGACGLIGLTTFASVVFAALQAWHIRRRNVSLAGLGTFSHLALRPTFQAGAGLAGLGVYGLFASELAGRAIASGLLHGLTIPARALRSAARRPGTTWSLARRLRDFYQFQMPASVLEVALVWMPLPLVAITYGPHWAGMITLVQRISTAPLALIGQSVIQIFYQRSAVLYRTDPERIIANALGILAAIGLAFLPVWALLLWQGPMLFSFLFGDVWADAGTVAAIWAPIVVCQIAGQLASRILILTGSQWIKLPSMLALIALFSIAMFAGQALGLDFTLSLALAVAVQSVIFIIWGTIALYSLRH